MKNELILIICGILLFVIFFWNIIEKEYKFNEKTEYFIETNSFSEGYQKVGEFTIINEWINWDMSEDCIKSIYNKGKGISFENLTYEQKYCLRLIPEEPTKKVTMEKKE